MKSPRPSRVRVGVANFAALLALAAQPAFAQNFWTNPGSGTWTDGFNWSNSVPPNGPGNEEGRINNGGTATIDELQVDPFTGLTGQITTGSLTLGDRPGNSGNLLMTSGQFLLKNTDLRIGGNPVTAIGGGVPAIGGTGVFTQTGGAVVQQGGNINIGIRGLNSMDPTVAEGTYNLREADPLVPSSCTVQFGFIVVIGNRAKGTLNQSGGSIEVRGLTSTNGGVNGSRFQLGRNAVNGTSFTSGTYNLSGGTATAGLFHFGHAAQTSGSSLNTLRLSGTGKLQVAEIEFLNTTIATNIFEFTGGTLSPYAIDFSTVTQSSSATITDVGTTTFTGTNGYTQTSAGNLAIDLDSFGNDYVDIGATGIANSSIAGRITVNLLNAFDPPVGTTFNILTASTVTNTAAVIGHTASCNYFRADVAPGGNGQILQLTVVAPPATYTQWQAIYRTGAFAADDDSDGISNGVEYVLGIIPKDVNGINGRRPVSSFTGIGAARRLRLDFPVAEPLGADATLQVQASADLGLTDPWTTIASKFGTGPWTGPAAVTLGSVDDCKVPTTVDDTTTVGATAIRFLRLRAVTP